MAARPRLRDGLLITLTFAAGAVDAFSYLGLGKVFTANMTGNIVLLGIAIGRGASPEALRAVASLIAYVLGVYLGSRLGDRWPRPEGWSTGVSLALAAEALAQAGLWAGWLSVGGHPGPGLQVVLVAASGLAMGLQSAVARTLGVTRVSTTYVTGTLTGLIGELGSGGGVTLERLRRGVVLVALFGGAALAALLFVEAHRFTPLLPLALTLAVLSVALAFLRGTPAEAAQA